jgi:epoxide hydrolase 4
MKTNHHSSALLITIPTYAHHISVTERFVTNNGTTLHYSKYGHGPYLVLQHGFPDRETTWDTFQVPYFAQHYTVLTPTLRGYPPSSIPPAASDYTNELFVSDLLTILNNENVDKAYILGHDIGGVVAQFFALMHPDRTAALIAVNTPILPTFLPLIEFDAGQQNLSRYTIPYFAYEPGQPKNVSTLVQHIRNHTYQAEIARYLEQSPIDGMLHFYSENYPAPPYGKNLSREGLVQKVPSMILWGTEDPYFSPKTIDGIEDWFDEGVRLVTVPGAGHWVFRDEPTRSNREIESFLKYMERIQNSEKLS